MTLDCYLVHSVHEFDYLKLASIMGGQKNDVDALRKINYCQLNDDVKKADFWNGWRKSMDRATLAVERIRVNSSQAALGPSGGDVQACGIFSKILTQRSPWSSQKMVASNDLSVTAVLVCGHVYHTECLEQVTPEACSLDPPCPVCFASENDVSKGHKLVGQVNACNNNAKDFSSNSQFSRNKLSRIGVANDDVLTYEGLSNFKSFERKSCLSINNGMKFPSSSNEKSFLNKSFSKRHFSSEENLPKLFCQMILFTRKYSGERKRGIDSHF